MRRAAAAALLCGLAVAAAPASAGSAPVPVGIQFQTYAPSQVDALPGETVEWTNQSDRRHTVTADDGSYDSGDLFGGDHFAHRFDAAGTYTFHCTVHLDMHGEVNVRRVILDPVPGTAVPAGQRVTLSGRSTGVAPVSIERDSGHGFAAVANAVPGPDGTWSASVPATTTSDYRAVQGTDVSETRRLLVSDRRVLVRATRHGVEATVTPPDPNARVVLQLRLRERFGWWPAASRRLDYLSRAEFRVRRRARLRVVLADRDGWTSVATSPVLRLIH